jgi:translation initiation factor IF-2
MLATASKAIIIGFAVSAEPMAERLAETSGISIRMYDVIYRVTEDVEKALKGLLEPEYKPVVVGRAEVRATFKIPKVGFIAGCAVREGELRRNAKMRVVRNGKVEFEGEISSLKHEKADVREVQKGFECGVPETTGFRRVIFWNVCDRTGNMTPHCDKSAWPTACRWKSPSYFSGR